MKSTLTTITFLLLSGALTFGQFTNGVSLPDPGELQPIVDLLGGKGSWVSTVLIWIWTIGFVLSPFAVRIRFILVDMLNEAAETSSVEDDVYLTKLFSSPWYRLLAFLANFINIRFPTLAELQRRLQREAVEKAKAHGDIQQQSQVL